MKQNNQFIIPVTRAFTIIFLIAALFVLPTHKAEAQNAIGLWYGGRITVPVASGYVWYAGVTVMYCPPHVWIAVIQPAYRKGAIAVFIPPSIPRANYNYFSPGVSVKGAYYPVPNTALCPFYPVYYGTEMGTSALP